MLMSEGEQVAGLILKDEGALKCKACASGDVQFDANQGHSFCATCGAVLEENVVVAEVTFAELANGTSVRQGQFISSDRGKAAAPTIFGKRRGFLSDGRQKTMVDGVEDHNGEPHPESREATIAAGRKRLHQIASALNLSDNQVDTAARWLLLALQHQFTRGRRAGSVAAACLYIVCRQEKTPHLLLDFSDVLQTSVYELGGIFLRLVRLLNLEIPLVDPSFYVGRFAAKLEFSDRTQAVANLALRLVARMKRDWINTGRRPGGVCAAALTIAARMHGFRRSNEEITRIVHICESTLAKRLEEFAATPSAQLTPAEFDGVWLEQEADPPAFTRAAAQAINRKEHFLKGTIQNAKDDDDGETMAGDVRGDVEEEGAAALPTPPLSCSSSVASSPKRLKRQSCRLTTPPRKVRDESETLSDFEDDWEVEAMIVSDEREVARKTETWMALNRDYLEKLEAKVTAALEAAARQGPADPSAPSKQPKRRRNVAKDRASGTLPNGPAAPTTAVEAVKQAMSTKRFSKKINYAALEQLLQDTAAIPSNGPK
jgi:transcription factor IIIB subunit 2